MQAPTPRHLTHRTHSAHWLLEYLCRMMRTTFAVAVLSLFVAVPAVAQDTAKPAPAKTIVQLVRDALNAKDFERAEVLATAEMANTNQSPISIEAFSWLARDLVSRKRYDEARSEEHTS